ncbi:unnamed protein product [Rotaria sp. Silwood1]|nr:unnamed protein product [Rotaria sp. Silwood1]CAF1416481.1 unnamed protein product [Rotaria sp. Silwood1]
MSSTNNEYIARFLRELKCGSILTKRKRNGEKYSRHFFLDEHEYFISYHQSEKVFAQPNRYYIHKMDEIRPGLQTRTFDRLFRHKIVEQDDQTIIKYQSNESISDYSLVSITDRKQVQKLIDEFETDAELQENGQLSLNGFRNLLLSDDFSLIKPWCSRHIYQDMTRPLSDYYINTSHNTYLFNNQILGDSNPEAYNRALCAGCRAVEIDCYDGANGRPIVKHGYTLVKPCLFESIIRFIEPNLFKTSPYPVILDLENHCSIEQQHEMARILRQVFGDRLITELLSTHDSLVLPSPEDLKYKVLIRGVKIPRPTTISKLFEIGEIDYDNNFFNPQSKIIEHHFAELIYFQNVSYLQYQNEKDNCSCCHSPNLAEKHFNRISQNDSIDLIKQTTKSSFRMYPDGFRQDSSNPNPINAWNFGIQMVALNFQNDDLMMSLSYGKFIDNGGCGYVLKPKYLINVHEYQFNPFNYFKKPSILPVNLFECPQRLTIIIISGQFLSRSSETTRDIPDPYVVVSTHGMPCDQQSQRTKFIENNGFDPLWNETFQFDIYFPQMCLVRFDVYDYDVFTRDDRLTYFCLPMTTMQTGYRHVHLRAKNNNLTYSTLFIHVSIENH